MTIRVNSSRPNMTFVFPRFLYHRDIFSHIRPLASRALGRLMWLIPKNDTDYSWLIGFHPPQNASTTRETTRRQRRWVVVVHYICDFLPGLTLRISFWCSLGLISLGCKAHAVGFDRDLSYGRYTCGQQEAQQLFICLIMLQYDRFSRLGWENVACVFYCAF